MLKDERWSPGEQTLPSVTFQLSSSCPPKPAGFADPSTVRRQAIISGVSARGVEELKSDSPGVKKSKGSCLWQGDGSQFIEQPRGKDLSSITWFALVLNGIRLSKDQTAVVTLGIDREGRKHVLDFALGSSEDLEVSRELMIRIVNRDFSCEHRLYVVLDGSEALGGAVVDSFADVVIQRCLVQKKRNIKGKLSKRHWGELTRLFTRLRDVQ